MTEYTITAAQVGTTWTPTGALRWYAREPMHPGRLEQEWRCLQTHQTEWRPVPIVTETDAAV
jgi:hypothetical protein